MRMKEKRIALLTGATGGLGACLLQELNKERLDEIWAFGRNAARLEHLRTQYGEKLKPVCADLTDKDFPARLRAMLEEERPNVVFLVNNAGAGLFKETADFTDEEIQNAIDLNCKAAPLIANCCLPYMQKGGRIINICSAAAFQPVPYINFYVACKAFLRSYSRAMNAELKPRRITVTAVCPGWIDTDFIIDELNGKKVKYPGLVKPAGVAKKALRDAKKGKDMSVYSGFMKIQHLLVKLLPQKLVMRIWINGTKKYLPRQKNEP